MNPTVTKKLQKLDGYIQQLRRFQSYRYDEIEGDLERIWAIERGLQISIQIIIDVGNHILASIGRNQIESYTDVLSKLGECDILPAEFVEKIKGMAGFRNILVHQYAEVDLRRVYDILQNSLDDFAEYIGYVQSYVPNRGRQNG